MYRIVALGFFIVFVVPAVIGFIVSRFGGMAAGIITGVIIFIGIVAMGWNHMSKHPWP